MKFCHWDGLETDQENLQDLSKISVLIIKMCVWPWNWNGFWYTYLWFKADKIVNNIIFHGKKPVPISWSNTHSYGQTDISPFHSNDKISCSKPILFQWQFFSPCYSNDKWSAPFHSSRISHTQGQPRLLAYLPTVRGYEPSLGTATKAIHSPTA